MTRVHAARACARGQILAASDAAVRVDHADGPPRLWFPRVDVEPEALADLDPVLWENGTGDVAEHVAFDHDRVEVVVVDGDGPDATTLRFPTWGDAADLVEVLDVARVGDLHFLASARADPRRPVVEGSQILGQAIVAAGRHAPDRRVVSATMAFPRAADARQPCDLVLDEVSRGRTFTCLGVRATQGERTCGAGTLLLDTTAPDVIRHADPQPPGPGPDGATPYDMSVTGRELRMVDDAYTGDPDAPVGPPELGAWVRFRDLPDDPPVHAALLAQMTGHLSIAAALRPHAGVGQDQAHRTLSTAVNAISLSLHAPVRADRWMRYHHRSTFAGDGMTHSECRVHDEGGALLASFTTDCMVRAFSDPSRGADARRTL